MLDNGGTGPWTTFDSSDPTTGGSSGAILGGFVEGATSVVTPEIKLIGAVAGVLSGKVGFSIKQLDKKFKHASDFGVNTTKKNPQTLSEFESALKCHLTDPATVQKGTYGFVKDSKVFFNPKTNNAVVLDSSGDFVTGFKLDPSTAQFSNFMQNGMLR